MRGEPRCPRCMVVVRPPGPWSSAWSCTRHGEVAPLQPVARPSAEVLAGVVAQAAVPVWLPWPLPTGWLVTGAAWAGDERTGARAVVTACSGPAPLGGVADLLVVAEEPGVGLGAFLAGLTGPDPGWPDPGSAPQAKVHAAGHPTSLWCVSGVPDRAVYVGEAKADWLWVLLWPEAAGLLLAEEVSLTDLCELDRPLDPPFGALCPRLPGSSLALQ